MTHRALLALGSNLGDRWSHLRGAVAALADMGGAVEVSSVYETPPFGGPEQGPYLNCVARLETDLGARALLEVAQRLEEAADRQREVRWGPRTLDVDLLWVDGEEVDEPDLEVPHPRMFERAFVLVPLRDVAPDLVAPPFVDGIPDDQGEILRVGEIDGPAVGTATDGIED